MLLSFSELCVWFPQQIGQSALVFIRKLVADYLLFASEGLGLMTVDKGEPYLSFLLRMWLVKNQVHQVWRFSLENVQTGERHGFASLEALCEFLSNQIDPALDSSRVDDVE